MMGFRPEEKGIKTAWRQRLSLPDVMGFRPEEKGIKTPRQAHYFIRQGADGIPT